MSNDCTDHNEYYEPRIAKTPLPKADKAVKFYAPRGWRLMPEKMTAAMINAWSGGPAVSSDEVAYRTPWQESWKRVVDAAMELKCVECYDTGYVADGNHCIACSEPVPFESKSAHVAGELYRISNDMSFETNRRAMFQAVLAREYGDPVRDIFDRQEAGFERCYEALGITDDRERSWSSLVLAIHEAVQARRHDFEFEGWFDHSYPQNDEGRRPKYSGTSVMELMREAFEAGRELTAKKDGEPIAWINEFALRCLKGNAAAECSPQGMREDDENIPLFAKPQDSDIDAANPTGQYKGPNLTFDRLNIMRDFASKKFSNGATKVQLNVETLLCLIDTVQHHEYVPRAQTSDEKAWGASTWADLHAALDGAHELSGAPHERINELIRQRDAERTVCGNLRQDYDALKNLCTRAETAAAEAQVELKRLRNSSTQSFENWWETVREEMIQDTDPRRHAESAWNASAANWAREERMGRGPVAWMDPSNRDPGQSVTFYKEKAEKWPHIYRQPLYAGPVARAFDLQAVRDGFDAYLKKYFGSARPGNTVQHWLREAFNEGTKLK